MGKWSRLIGIIPSLDPGASYGDAAQRLADLYDESELDAVVAELESAKAAKDSADRVASEAELRRRGLEIAVMRQLARRKLESVVVNGRRYTPSPEPQPKVVDRDALRAYFMEHQPEVLTVNFQTLAALVKDALSPNGSAFVPPGVEVQLHTSLSNTKVPTKE